MIKIRAKWMACAALAVAALASPMRAQEGDGRMPRSFFLPKTQYDLPSWWRLEGPQTYRESYEPGSGVPDNILQVVGRGTMNGVPGTIVYRPEVAVFVPDAGTNSEWVGLHWLGEWKEKWRPIEQVQ